MPRRRTKKNPLGLRDAMGRGVEMLRQDHEVIFSAEIPPDR
jgi:hypothetical protein